MIIPLELWLKFKPQNHGFSLPLRALQKAWSLWVGLRRAVRYRQELVGY